MKGVIHYNPYISHQVDFAKAFSNCGFKATTCRFEQADIHVIYGPHYCLHTWQYHPRVLYIDRAWWGHDQTKPGDGFASIGWLQPDGTRKFASGTADRPKPAMHSWKKQWTMGEIRCMVLADYGQDVSETVRKASERFPSVRTRVHPADSTDVRVVTLEMDVQFADVVIGHSGTGIFEALKFGTPVICTDTDNPCMPVCSSMDEPLYRGDREAWLHDMSYKQWSLDEIASGEAWEHLKDIQ